MTVSTEGHAFLPTEGGRENEKEGEKEAHEGEGESSTEEERRLHSSPGRMRIRRKGLVCRTRHNFESREKVHGI